MSWISLKRYLMQRIEGLHDELRSGRPRTHDDDDGGPGLNSLLSRTLEAGTYIVEATTWNSRDPGISSRPSPASAEPPGRLRKHRRSPRANGGSPGTAA